MKRWLTKQLDEQPHMVFLWMSVTAVIVLISIGLLLGPHKAHAQNPTVSLGTNGFNCIVTVSTAITIQEVGGSCLAPSNAILRIYITDINFSTNASGIAADSFPTLKSGTKVTTACDTNPAVVWQAFTPAAVQTSVVDHFVTPIRLPLASELCWINTTAGSKTIQINGYVGQ